jgi:hypothetical protein
MAPHTEGSHTKQGGYMLTASDYRANRRVVSAHAADWRGFCIASDVLAEHGEHTCDEDATEWLRLFLKLRRSGLTFEPQFIAEAYAFQLTMILAMDDDREPDEEGPDDSDEPTYRIIAADEITDRRLHEQREARERGW